MIEAMKELREEYGGRFDQVFKTITDDKKFHFYPPTRLVTIHKQCYNRLRSIKIILM